MGFCIPFQLPGKARNKYGAKRTVVDNIKFASKKESRRYQALKVLFSSGQIHNLELQPKFPFKLEGELMFTYVADFAYFDGKGRIVEDVKGVKTAIYKLKKKIIEKVYKIKICEV